MAAAGSAGRWQRANERHHEAEVLRRKASHNRRIIKERTGEKFDELSADGEWIMEDQVTELLEKAMMRAEGSLQPTAVQLVVDTARRYQKEKDMEPPHDKPGALAKRPLMQSAGQYGEYIRNYKKIDAVFEKYDKEKDGYLSKKELRKMLQDRELKQNRSKKGVSIRLMVTDEDIDWIIQECDADGAGMINQAEYLPAIAAWEELAQMKLDNPDRCVIM